MVNSIWIGNIIGEIGVATITNCYSTNIMLSAIIAGLGVVVFAVVIILTSFFMHVLGTSKSTRADARIYLSVYSFIFVSAILLSVMGEFVKAFGDTKTPPLFVDIGIAINMVLSNAYA